MHYYNYLLKALDLTAQDYLLDYGCGKGKLLQYLQDIPSKILAIDTDEDSLFFASQKFKDHKIEFRNISSPKQITDIKFDKIICHNVLECVEDKIDFINQFAPLLKTDGLLVLSHFDFDSAIYNSPDKALSRSLIHHFADHIGNWQKSANFHVDGQIGRKMPGLLKNSVFKKYHWQVLRLIEDEFSDGYYGYLMAQMLIDCAKKIYANEILLQWQTQLQSLNKSSEYFFAIDLFIGVLGVH